MRLSEVEILNNLRLSFNACRMGQWATVSQILKRMSGDSGRTGTVYIMRTSMGCNACSLKKGISKFVV